MEILIGILQRGFSDIIKCTLDYISFLKCLIGNDRSCRCLPCMRSVTDGWMDGRMDGQTDGWTDGPTNTDKTTCPLFLKGEIINQSLLSTASPTCLHVRVVTFRPLCLLP